MKKVGMLLMPGALMVLLAGCASPLPMGAFYTGVKLPVGTSEYSGKAPKVGTAICESYLGMVAIGDASIEAAKANAGITKVHHVDYEAKNILGLYGKYTVTVHGE